MSTAPGASRAGLGEQPVGGFRVSGLHHASVAVPVTTTQPLGNDQIQRPADRFGDGLAVAEEGRCCSVPEHDHSRRIGDDNPIGEVLHQLPECVALDTEVELIVEGGEARCLATLVDGFLA